ncbi:lipopolysaccharide-induced tumor necrosis factor-alpha factor homolog isoform X1 [Condylostylus longicornis]|uniref:lipopolysaccharide-induced tumor necrosis factor-alpha factor homolog isoform X1 n=1 Tax=Condylostylus longicornis TaxID=2530218 RepID=UPI00244DB7A3|nr:lipopolysaccharide-induced tumor necrosis factor-alpha factor homolog isoform X1 [Condylostylus longicornis]
MENKLARYPNYANNLTPAEIVYRRNSASSDHRRLSRNLQEITSQLPREKPIIKLEGFIFYQCILIIFYILIHTYIVSRFLPVLGQLPSVVKCCNCNQTRYTKIVYEIGAKTHIAALFFTLIGMCCIPYCCQRFKYCSHFCNNCNQYLGTSQV